MTSVALRQLAAPYLADDVSAAAAVADDDDEYDVSYDEVCSLKKTHTQIVAATIDYREY